MTHDRLFAAWSISRRACLCLCLVGPASSVAGEPYRDSNYALTLDIPDGYVVERQQLAHGMGLYLEEKDTDSFCTIAFLPAPGREGNQAKINEHAATMLSAIIEEDRKDHTLGPVTPFVLGDAEGLTFEATTEQSADTARLRFVYVYLETTKGHAQFVCATSKAAFAGAKPTFDRLFRSVRLP